MQNANQNQIIDFESVNGLLRDLKTALQNPSVIKYTYIFRFCLLYKYIVDVSKYKISVFIVKGCEIIV